MQHRDRKEHEFYSGYREEDRGESFQSRNQRAAASPTWVSCEYLDICQRDSQFYHGLLYEEGPVGCQVRCRQGSLPYRASSYESQPRLDLLNDHAQDACFFCIEMTEPCNLHRATAPTRHVKMIWETWMTSVQREIFGNDVEVHVTFPPARYCSRPSWPASISVLRQAPHCFTANGTTQRDTAWYTSTGHEKVRARSTSSSRTAI